MVRYFYAWIPLGVLVGTVVLMACPYLAVLVFLAVLLAVVAALVALVWATVSALYALARSALAHTTAHASRQRGDTSPRITLNAGGIGGGGTR
jgi:hypothetical protein